MPTVILSRPAQGQETIVIASDQNAMFALGFSTSDVTLSRDGDSLVFTFEDGAVIRIDDFYTSYHADNIPEFEVAGKIVSGAEFFSTLGPDLSPAAGPTAVERSSHYAEHGDSALASGLEHLDSLDYRTENAAFSDGPLLMDGPDMARAPSATGGGPDGGGNNGQDTHSPYHTRLIVSDTSANTFNFFAVDEDGNIVNDASKITNLEFEGDNTYFAITGVAPDGRITVELTAAGLAALNDGTLASDTLLISVDGVEYKMPLLVNGGPAGQSYDAADEEARAQIGGDLKAEWYATDSKTVSNDTITLGGTNYNQADIDQSTPGSANNIGMLDSNIDITASAKGEVNITAHNDAGSAYGLSTDESGPASSSVRGGDASSININAQTTGATGAAYGVHTSSADQNTTATTIIDGGNVSIKARAAGDGAYGMLAGANATNTISANQNIDITAQASSGGATGLITDDPNGKATNSLKAGADITITASGGGGSAIGIDNGSGNTTHVESIGDVTLTANSTSDSATGIRDYGNTTVIAGKNLTIEASTQGNAEARAVESNYLTKLTALDGDMTVRAEGDTAIGFYTDNTHAIIANASGRVDIQAQGQGNATAVHGDSVDYGNPFNSIVGNEVSITAQTLQAGDTYGLYSYAALNQITADTQVTVRADNQGTGTAWGMYTGYDQSKAFAGNNKITGHDITVTSTAANGDAYAMYAVSDGNNNAGNILHLEGGTANISAASNPATGGYSAHAMQANDTGYNLITGSGTVNVAASSTGKSALGMSADRGSNSIGIIEGTVNVSAHNSGNTSKDIAIGMAATSGDNSIDAGNGNVTLSATGGGVSQGMYAASGVNTIKANGDVNVNASGDILGYGMNATDSGKNTITVEGGNVAVTSSNYAMNATSSGSNSIATENGDVTLNAGAYSTAQAMSATDAGSSNTITSEGGNITVTAKGYAANDAIYATSYGTNTITTKDGDVNVDASGGYAASGMNANLFATNVINAENGDVNVSGHSATGGGKGMSAESGGSNTINADNGNVTISGSGSQLSYGMFASFSGSNTINAGGDVTIMGDSNTDSAGMAAISSGSNTINAGGNVNVTASGSSSGVYAGGYAQSTINAGGNVNVTVDGKDATGAAIGVSSSDHANNTIKTGSGDVSVTAIGSARNTASAMSAITYADTIISTETGDVTLTSSHYGMFTETSGHNTITTDSGKVDITAGSGFDNGFGMYATKSGLNDIITAGSDVTVTANGSNSSQGMATESGSNSITTYASGNVTVTAGGSGTGYGMRGSGAGGNAIKTQDGNVHVAGGELGVSAIGYGMLADNRSQNVITTNGGDVSITGSGDSAYGMTAANGGINTIKAIGGEVDVTANGSSNSYGMAATDGGINLIQPGSGPVTVTITATADSAEKAIAMWADGGNSVNYITGSSKAGGLGDSITLNANNGQGIAMQAENGGQNIITTGAGNDSVTINGDIKGSGNEINLSRGDNTLTLNGAVEQGSLNVKTEGIGASAGTYTLILQAPDAESFVSHYGDWLNDIGSDDFIANGMTGITFDGLDVSTLPPDFLAEFNDILWDLHAEGVAIQPPELVDQLHAPAGSFSAPLSAMADDTGVEHHTQGAQHAAGHDDVQDSLPPAHDGQDSVTDGGQHAAFNAHSDPAGHASAIGADTLAAGTPGADALEHDATVPAHFSAEADEQIQPLFASLSGHAADMPADASADMPLEGGDDTLHSGHPGNEAADSGALAGLHASITLACANENFDSLFVATTVQAAEQDETGPEVTALHDVPLTSMNAVLVQSHLAGSAAHDSPAAVAESTITVTDEISNASSVMDSCQENTDNAAREMASC